MDATFFAAHTVGSQKELEFWNVNTVLRTALQIQTENSPGTATGGAMKIGVGATGRCRVIRSNRHPALFFLSHTRARQIAPWTLFH